MSRVGIKILPPELAERGPGWFSYLTAQQRLIVDRRIWIVGQWERARTVGRDAGQREAEITAAFIRCMAPTSPPRLSRETLYEWRRSLRYDGAFGLVDLRWFRGKPKPTASWPFIRTLAAIYRRSGKRPLLRHLEALKAAEYHGWTRCTLLESTRWIRGQLMPSKSPLLCDDYIERMARGALT